MPPVIGWCGRRRQVAGRRGVRGPTEACGTVGIEGRGREKEVQTRPRRPGRRPGPRMNKRPNSDAQVAREIVLALPANAGISTKDRVDLARSFAE